MESSVFLKKEGSIPKNKVLEFLIISQEFDYSLKDIAKYARISYPCMKQLRKELSRDKWIILTRKVGRAQMYRLNLQNQKVQKFIDFFWSVVDEGVDKHLGIEKKEVSSINGPTAIPASARHV